MKNDTDPYLQAHIRVEEPIEDAEQLAKLLGGTIQSIQNAQQETGLIYVLSAVVAPNKKLVRLFFKAAASADFISDADIAPYHPGNDPEFQEGECKLKGMGRPCVIGMKNDE